jgi:hypothetical protein
MHHSSHLKRKVERSTQYPIFTQYPIMPDISKLEGSPWVGTDTRWSRPSVPPRSEYFQMHGITVTDTTDSTARPPTRPTENALCSHIWARTRTLNPDRYRENRRLGSRRMESIRSVYSSVSTVNHPHLQGARYHDGFLCKLSRRPV